jgi:Holliday junction resolvase RusA-like endonuclease
MADDILDPDCAPIIPEWAPVAKFLVPGTPVGQPRPRFDIRGRRPRAYDPGTADQWRALISLLAVRHRPKAPITQAVYVVISFYFPRAKARKPAQSQRFHTGKPDIDNCAKVVLDALTDIGFWTDDSLVVACDAIKYATVGEPGAEIEVFQERLA